MRLPFFRTQAKAQADRGRPPVQADPAALTAARTRARRRLVGALVLLVIGVVGFPVLFETQPRPLALDTPIELPHRDGAPAVMPPPRPNPASKPLPVMPDDAGVESAAAPVEAASAPAVIAAITAARAPSPAPTTVAGPPPAPVTRPVLAATTAAPPPPAAATASAAQPVAAEASAAAGRYVVQVGAYSDATKLREARAKVEKLGFKTYTQVIDSEAGKRTRVRVGPYATREEADAAAAKVKLNGLPAAILTL